MPEAVLISRDMMADGGLTSCHLYDAQVHLNQQSAEVSRDDRVCLLSGEIAGAPEARPTSEAAKMKAGVILIVLDVVLVAGRKES